MNNKLIPVLVVAALFAGAAYAGDGAVESGKPKNAEAGTAPHAVQQPTAKRQVSNKLVNLNAATAAELKKLPGGSDEEAARIIAGRPYNSKAFLVTNQVIGMGRYAQIKGLVVAGELPKQDRKLGGTAEMPAADRK